MIKFHFFAEAFPHVQQSADIWKYGAVLHIRWQWQTLWQWQMFDVDGHGDKDADSDQTTFKRSSDLGKSHLASSLPWLKGVSILQKPILLHFLQFSSLLTLLENCEYRDLSKVCKQSIRYSWCCSWKAGEVLPYCKYLVLNSFDRYRCLLKCWTEYQRTWGILVRKGLTALNRENNQNH